MLNLLSIKSLLGFASIGVQFVGYAPYFRDLYRGTTKPHVFSWFIWGLLQAIAFTAQIMSGGGAGAWQVGTGAVLCFIVAGIALFAGEKNITKTDWACFIGALLGVLAWISTSNPVWAVLIVSAVDTLGFIPTFRKAYMKPHEETAFVFAMATVACVLSLFALESYSVTTWFYLATLVVTNGSFVVYLVIRRAQLKGSTM